MARAAAAQPAPASTTVATAPQPAAPTPVVAAVAGGANAAAEAARTGSQRAASRLGAAPQRAASRLGAAPQRAAAAIRAVPSRLVAAVKAGVVNTLSQLGTVVSTVRPDAPAPRTAAGAPAVTPSGGVVVSHGGTRPATAAGQARRADVGAAPARQVHSGLRNTPAAPVERVGGAPAGLAAPTTSQPGGAASAGASPAAAAATALLGLLGLLIFIAQRQGSLIRLRPAWAPAPPFLALSERPG